MSARGKASAVSHGIIDIQLTHIPLGMLREQAVNCDLDGSQLELKFTNDAYAAEYFAKFHDWNDHFLVGGAKWNCSIHQVGTPTHPHTLSLSHDNCNAYHSNLTLCQHACGVSVHNG